MRYLIKKHHHYINHSRGTKVLGWVEAKNRDEAKVRANEEWGCHQNQLFEVLTYDEASFEDISKIPVAKPLS